jgi:hypothetical protein
MHPIHIGFDKGNIALDHLQKMGDIPTCIARKLGAPGENTLEGIRYPFVIVLNATDEQILSSP